MGWSLDLRQLDFGADRVLLVVGRASHIAQRFESKCKFLVEIGNLSAIIRDRPNTTLEDAVAQLPKDQLLKGSLERLAVLLPEAKDQESVLDRAREARNYIAHEAAQIDIHNPRDEDLEEHLDVLYGHVHALAVGDNYVSTWVYAVEYRDALMVSGTLPHLAREYVEIVEPWVLEPVADFH